MDEKREYKSGTVSTKQPRLSLIPHQGLVNAAKRFELGLEKHGEKAWNNLSPNQEALKDEEWLIERCSHVIEHCYSLIDFLTRKKSSVQRALGDAGAISWGGLVLGEALSQISAGAAAPDPAQTMIIDDKSPLRRNAMPQTEDSYYPCMKCKAAILHKVGTFRSLYCDDCIKEAKLGAV